MILTKLVAMKTHIFQSIFKLIGRKLLRKHLEQSSNRLNQHILLKFDL